jgi:3-phenylpropionate/trans-cinnamate dioxygenase ferredoxin subunit
MADVSIKALKNGPYEVTGTVELQDADGKAKPSGDDPIYLCRCGRSSTKPFCDGTHRKVGFEG